MHADGTPFYQYTETNLHTRKWSLSDKKLASKQLTHTHTHTHTHKAPIMIQQ
jgi:hypothetical protein